MRIHSRLTHRSLAAIAAVILSSAAGAQNAPSAAAALHPSPVTRPPAKHPGNYVAYGFAPGELVADVKFKDVNGKSGTLATLVGSNDKGVVIVTRDAECPVVKRYSPRLAELERTYAAKGFRFVYLDVTPHSSADAKKDAAANGLTGRVILDTAHVIADALRATSTAEAFVIDARGTLRYRGAIDDQYGVTYQRATVTKAWLRNALDQVAAEKDVMVPSTDVSGCLFDVDMNAPGAARPVTYNNRISRLMQSKCESCHREQGLAPMPLETYDKVFARRAIIAQQVRDHRMPPWNANKSVGQWANDVSLADRDIADLLGWIKDGAPKGDEKQAPLPRKYTPLWEIGAPDAVVQVPDAFSIPAEGIVSYKNSYVQTHFDSDKWVTAIEIKPTAPAVVHHVLVFLDPPNLKGANDPTRKPGDPVPSNGVSGFFAATAPGSGATVFPLGAAKKLPKDSWLKFQIHYQPNGKDVVDQSRIGFRFADDSIVAAGTLMEVETKSAANTRFVIPAFDPNYMVEATYIFRKSGTLISLFPHTHLRGKAWKIELMAPDSTKTLVLDVPRYDFNWQTGYRFKNPVHVDSGMRVIATAWYDNSTGNPSNPDPSKAVRFGEQTFDEMMIGYFDWIPDALPKPAAPSAPQPVPSSGPARPSSKR